MRRHRHYLFLCVALTPMVAASCKARNQEASEVKGSPYGYAAPNVAEQDFDAEVLKAPAGEPVVVMFYAEGWISPRKTSGFYTAAAENKDILFRTVDQNRNQSLFLTYGINSDGGTTTSSDPLPGLPVIMIFKDGKPSRRLSPPDSFSKEKIEAAIRPPQVGTQAMLPKTGIYTTAGRLCHLSISGPTEVEGVLINAYLATYIEVSDCPADLGTVGGNFSSCPNNLCAVHVSDGTPDIFLKLQSPTQFALSSAAGTLTWSLSKSTTLP